MVDIQSPTAEIRRGKKTSSAVAEMGNRLATVGMGRKWGGKKRRRKKPQGKNIMACPIT